MKRSTLALLVVVLAAGCGKPDPANRFVRPDQVLDFRTLYAQNCSGCHGRDGWLGPAPPLADALFLALISDDELRQVLVHGRPGTPMPAFARPQGGPLTAQQIDALVAGLRGQWGMPAGAAQGKLPPYRQAEPGDPGRGAQVFAGRCARCHGVQGQGGEFAGGLRDPAFLALVSDQRLWRTVITGRSDLGMPGCADHAKPMTEQEAADVVALLVSWRGSAK